MRQPNIVILDGEDRQPVGLELRAILRQERVYRVNLVDRVDGPYGSASETAPRLVIPVLPEIPNRADKLLTELQSTQKQVPILPVMNSAVLSAGLAERFASTDDFLLTPLREAEVRARVRRLANLADFETSDPTLVVAGACGLAQIIGEDPAFVNVKRKIPLIARFESTVLLTGETGTGKERFARALHYSSRRAMKPFLPVNCGAIPQDLFESELYGHHKGAFTGASVNHPGLIAEAKDGTLFLDEIETLSLASQVKLLRFLQDQTYYAVGSARPTQANVWIVASTNRQLPAMVREGTFREDLYYRLAVLSLELPPLRQRTKDIPLLAAHFWNQYAARAGRRERCLSPEVMEALSWHSWPGNVRELENVIQQLAVLTESDTICPEHLPLPKSMISQASQRASFAQRKSFAIAEFERTYLTELLQTHNGNVTRAAHEAGKDRRALGRLIKKHRLAKR